MCNRADTRTSNADSYIRTLFVRRHHHIFSRDHVSRGSLSDLTCGWTLHNRTGVWNLHMRGGTWQIAQMSWRVDVATVSWNNGSITKSRTQQNTNKGILTKVHLHQIVTRFARDEASSMQRPDTHCETLCFHQCVDDVAQLFAIDRALKMLVRACCTCCSTFSNN